MKYMISWFERPQGSPTEYENAQKRILDVFSQWKAPANFKIELFVVRVGEWGGHVLVDCDTIVRANPSLNRTAYGRRLARTLVEKPVTKVPETALLNEPALA